MKRVSDTYLNENFGIFKLLQTNNYAFLPTSDNSLPVKLDNLYYYQNSGDKCLSPYYHRLYKIYDDGEKTEAEINALVMVNIANSVALMFGDKWTKLYNSLVVAQYDALNNYDITEEEEPDITTEDTIRDNTYGFDTESEDGEPRDLRSATRTTTGTNTKTRTGRDGRVTPQKLLEQELVVRENLFYEILFRDIDSIIALKIYE